MTVKDAHETIQRVVRRYHTENAGLHRSPDKEALLILLVLQELGLLPKEDA